MKIFFFLLLLVFYLCGYCLSRMFRFNFIKNNTPRIKKQCQHNTTSNIKREVEKLFCSRNNNKECEVNTFYGIKEKGFRTNRAPPYLLNFKNCRDILAYTNDIDKDCLLQIQNLARLDIIKGHITILPDVHLGKGIIIGSVFLTKDFIIPNGVGVDIGCGVLCIKINNLKKKDLNEKIINNIYNKIKRNIPLSFDMHDQGVFDSKNIFSNLLNTYGSPNIKGIVQLKHFKQLGTLGGGNHFIEIVYDASDDLNKTQKEELSIKDETNNIYVHNNVHDNMFNENDISQKNCAINTSLLNAKGNRNHISNNNSVDKKNEVLTEYNYSNVYKDISLNNKNDDLSDVYILIHSGSRNIGKSVAEFYDILASEESKMKRNDLAYLDLKKDNGKNYLKDMKVCLEYAKYNRIYMMKIIEKIIYEETKCTLNWDQSINIHHNFCNYEKVMYLDNNEIKKEYMYVTRKGATSSKKNQYGIIPGNMKTGSYIVKGKGNVLSYNSCSHGCGRVLSRTKAKQFIKQQEFIDIMKGVKCDTNNKIRDEAPQAYKNLNQVLKNQESLIYLIKKLNPIINIKGF